MLPCRFLRKHFFLVGASHLPPKIFAKSFQTFFAKVAGCRRHQRKMCRRHFKTTRRSFLFQKSGIIHLKLLTLPSNGTEKRKQNFPQPRNPRNKTLHRRKTRSPLDSREGTLGPKKAVTGVGLQKSRVNEEKGSRAGSNRGRVEGV